MCVCACACVCVCVRVCVCVCVCLCVREVGGLWLIVDRLTSAQVSSQRGSAQLSLAIATLPLCHLLEAMMPMMPPLLEAMMQTDEDQGYARDGSREELERLRRRVVEEEAEASVLLRLGPFGNPQKVASPMRQWMKPGEMEEEALEQAPELTPEDDGGDAGHEGGSTPGHESDASSESIDGVPGHESEAEHEGDESEGYEGDGAPGHESGEGNDSESESTGSHMTGDVNCKCSKSFCNKEFALEFTGDEINAGLRSSQTTNPRAAAQEWIAKFDKRLPERMARAMARAKAFAAAQEVAERAAIHDEQQWEEVGTGADEGGDSSVEGCPGVDGEGDEGSPPGDEGVLADEGPPPGDGDSPSSDGDDDEPQYISSGANLTAAELVYFDHLKRKSDRLREAEENAKRRK